MKAPSFGYGRFALQAFALVALLLLQGCHEEHLAWSPDGRTLAVWNVGGGGIRFSDTTGALTPELYPGVRRAQWFADSRRLVLATSSELADWKTVEPLLDAAERRLVEVELGKLREAIAALPVGALLEEKKGRGTLGELLNVCLKASLGRSERERLSPGYRDTLGRATATRFELVEVAVEAGALRKLRSLDQGFGLPEWIGLSPTGRELAYARPVLAGGNNLCVVAVGGREGEARHPLFCVAEQVAPLACWTPEGTGLVFARAVNRRAASRTGLRGCRPGRRRGSFAILRRRRLARRVASPGSW